MSKITKIKPFYDTEVLAVLMKKYDIKDSFARMAINGMRTSDRALALKNDYEKATSKINKVKNEVINEIQ